MIDLTGGLSGTTAAIPVLWVPAPGRDRPSARTELGRAGLAVRGAADLADALRLATDRPFGLCLVDLADGRAALASVRAMHTHHPQLPIVAVLDAASSMLAGDAIHHGASDILPWPFAERDLAMVVANARDRAGVEMPVADSGVSDDPVFSHSAAMRQAMDAVEQHAAARLGLALCGEPGSGRRLLARTLHQLGDPTGARPFIEVDCDNVTPQQLDDRLFGASTDAATGSVKADVERIGRASAIARARGGTLFLTNLAEAPARVQARLARLLRDREGILVGGKREAADLDIRAVAAFEPSADQRVREGDLRADLYERLAHARVEVPPLRRRREDIPLLAVHFLKTSCQREGTPARSFSRSSLALLAALPWPGNAPELRSLIDLLVPAVHRPVIQLDDLLERATLDGVATRIDAGVSLRDAKARFERDCISAVLLRHHGRVGEAAKALGIQRTNLYRKVRQLNVARSLLAARK